MTREYETVSVSLIVPAYNAERYIGFTIESLIRQSHADLEIIVVDDGSTDGSREIACGYAETDDRITALPQNNLGVATARNTGIEVAKGEFVGFINADDIWHSTAVAKMLSRFEGAAPDLGVVYTWSTDIDAENRTTGGQIDPWHAIKWQEQVSPANIERVTAMASSFMNHHGYDR